MSDEREDAGRAPDADPFLADDPAAFERERRRQQREAKRRQRAGRKSLASRVGGAIDGAAGRGREAIEQGREQRAARRTEPPAGAEPPSFRRPRLEVEIPPAEPAPDSPPPEQRMSAEELMPHRRTRLSEAPAGTPGEVSTPVPDATQAPDPDWFTDTDTGPPPEIPPSRRAVGTGEYPPLPPPTAPPPGASRSIWLRRLAAIGILLLLVLAVYAVARMLGGSDPAPAPKGPATLKTSDVTIPEGYTRSQIADVAKEAGLKGNYEKATAKAPKGFDIEKMGAPGDATLEGFLFPATYNLEKGASVDDLVKEQLTAFNTNMDEVDLKAAKKKNLTEFDVVTIASMIEREVLVPKERRLVAAVIYNRLAQGIPLGIDATLRYDLDNFDEPLKESELQSDSPYNTRIVTGLPPSPIANPGLDSLQAAADPANVDYLYYVVKPDTCGKHYFTDDYDDFLAASDKYDAAREAQGGAPTDC